MTPMSSPSNRRVLTEARLNTPGGPAAVGADGTVTTPLPATAYAPVTDRRATTEGAALKKAAQSASFTVAATGHSLMYGQDTSATGTTPATNGAPQTRSSRPPVESLDTALDFVTAAGATVVNQGFPGDQTKDALTRWASGVSGDVELIWADTNDAKNYSGDPAGPATVAQSQDRIAALCERAIKRGAQPIIIGGSPLADLTDSRLVRAYTQAHRRVADRFGAPFIDAQELLRPLGTSEVWTDGVHLTGDAYGIIGARLGALFGPQGATPPRVAPGVTIRPRDNLHNGGAITARASAPGGYTIRLTAGQVLTVPVDATTPCAPLVRLYSDAATGTGTGELINHFTKSGLTGPRVDIPTVTGRESIVRARHLDHGPDALILRCLTGALEVSGVDFIADKGRVRAYNDATTSRTRRSDLAGVTLPALASGWNNTTDPTTPVSVLDSTGAVAKTRVEFLVDLPEPAAGKTTGVAVLASAIDTADYGIRSGYWLLRDAGSGTLTVREADQEAFTGVGSAAGVFTVGTTFRGLLAFEFVGTSLNVYVDNVLKATVPNPKWRHYFPALIGNAPVTALAVTATGNRYAL